jgi:TRAP transporter 4TM/12TM fusion protein
MKKCGFPSISAGAIEAVASTGGQLMPPIMGAAAFVMAELLEIPYFSIAKSGALPAFFYFVSLGVFVEFAARKSQVRKVDLENLPDLWKTLRNGLVYIVPVIGLMALLITHHSPAKSAVFSIVLILLVSVIKKDIRKRISLKSLIEALRNGATGTVSTAAACACAGIVVGMVNLTGLGLKMSSGIISLAGGSLPMVLLMVAISCMILGMGMPTTASYIIVAVLGAPALMELGVGALSAHLFVFYFAVISNITPPVALAAFAGAGIAKSPPMKTGFEAVKFGILAYLLPFLFVYRPEILLTEGWGLILWSVICISLGIYAIAIALVGYLHTPLNWVWRLSYLGAAMLFFQKMWWGNLLGLAFLIVVVYINRKDTAAATN